MRRYEKIRRGKLSARGVRDALNDINKLVETGSVTAKNVLAVLARLYRILGVRVPVDIIDESPGHVIDLAPSDPHVRPIFISAFQIKPKPSPTPPEPTYIGDPVPPTFVVGDDPNAPVPTY